MPPQTLSNARQVVEQVKADAALYFGGGVNPKLLRRRPLTVEAMQVHVGHEHTVAMWCQGVAVYGRGVVVWTESGDLVHADYGDWIIRGPRGEFTVSDDRGIFSDYEAVIPLVTE